VSRQPERNAFRGPFGGIPVEVMKSAAWKWLPHFSRSTLIALAGKYSGSNNGSLDLPSAETGEYGLSRDEGSYGLRLAITAGLIIKTANARGRSGRGKPAKYLLTWHGNYEYPTYNLLEAQPRDNWARFDPPCPPIKSLNAARRFFGNRATSAGKYRPPPGGEVLKVTSAATSNKQTHSDTATPKDKLKNATAM
jgi:hypothetical protein